MLFGWTIVKENVLAFTLKNKNNQPASRAWLYTCSSTLCPRAWSLGQVFNDLHLLWWQFYSKQHYKEGHQTGTEVSDWLITLDQLDRTSHVVCDWLVPPDQSDRTSRIVSDSLFTPDQSDSTSHIVSGWLVSFYQTDFTRHLVSDWLVTPDRPVAGRFSWAWCIRW